MKTYYCWCCYSEANEKEVKNLNNQIRDVDRQREAAMREVGDLKVQLKLVEETRDNVRRDLIEANRRIREGETRNLQANCFSNLYQQSPLLYVYESLRH